ncbi:MAG: acyltransferase family protein [Halioglobus sp.]
MNTVQKIYEPHIDVLRAIAIFGVLMHHLEIMFEGGGFLGVDVFFVISGYLITRNIVFEKSNEKWSFASFYIRRIRRLLPAYLVTIFITLVLGYFLFPVQSFNNLGDNALLALVHVSNLSDAYWWSGYFSQLSGYNPLLHLWSLNVEEQIYLFWPVLVIIALSYQSRILPFVILIAGVSSLAIAHHYASTSGSSYKAFFHMEARLFEFCLGAAVLWIPTYSNPKTKIYQYSCTLLSLAGLLLILAAYHYGSIWNRPYNVLSTSIGAILVIYAGRHSNLDFFFRNRGLVAVGLISYSLYLVHWPIYIYLKYWLYSPYNSQIQLQFYSLLLSILSSLALYKLVETRFRIRSSKVGRAFDRAPFIFCGVVFFCGLALAVTAKMEGDDSSRISPPEGIVSSRPIMPRFDKSDCDKYYDSLRCDFLGRKGEEIDILAIGDSHQLHLWSLYRRLADELHVNIAFWVGPDCPPMLGTQTVLLKDLTPIKTCSVVNRKWLDYTKTEKPPVMILTGSWYRRTENFSGYGTYGLKYDEPSAVLRRYYNPLHPDWSPRKTFSHGLSKSLNILLQYSNHIMVIGPVPPIAAIPRDCYLTPNFLINEDQQLNRCKQVSYPQMKRKFSFVDNSIRSHAESKSGVEYFLLSELFCSEQLGECRLIDDSGQIAYSDEHHLSEEGMAFVTENAFDALSKFIEESGVADRSIQ